jgi:hypothetical protein
MPRLLGGAPMDRWERNVLIMAALLWLAMLAVIYLLA